MADLDLERIITDLRARREKVAQQMEETNNSSVERAQLFEAAGRLRDRINHLVGRTDQQDESVAPPSSLKDEPGR
jgi:hypothetical protein